MNEHDRERRATNGAEPSTGRPPRSALSSETAAFDVAGTNSHDPTDALPTPNDESRPAPSEPPREVLLSVRGLGMSFGDKRVLDDIDFDVHRGEVYGCIGPNGAGKTTTIRILSTLLIPTVGEVLFDGIHAVEQPETVRRRIGYMPDHFGIYHGLSVREYLEFFAGAYRVPRKKQKRVIDDVIELTDLGRLADEEAQYLSKGMKQRLCLAQTLVHDPELLILDEPASGLDPRARIEFRALLKQLARMGKTIFLSSHILTEMSMVCDAVGIIEQGRLVRSGRISDILAELRSADACFEVQLVDNRRDIVGPLLRHPAVSDVFLRDRRLRFRYEGAESQLHEVFAIFARERVSFLSVAREEENLESLFMRLTQGEVS